MFCLPVLFGGPATAAPGPENVFVVINAADEPSVTLAHAAYCERGIRSFARVRGTCGQLHSSGAMRVEQRSDKP
jgi:hypothetical protein